MYYARFDGEAEEVAIALNEQYLPRFAGDKLPDSLVACAVSLADKLDSLVGIFGIKQNVLSIFLYKSTRRIRHYFSANRTPTIP